MSYPILFGVMSSSGEDLIGTLNNPAVSGLQLYNAGYPSGAYYIKPNGVSTATLSYVDNSTDGGGWVLIHKTRGQSENSNTNDRTDSGYNISSLADLNSAVAINTLEFNNSSTFQTWKVVSDSFGSGKAKMFWYKPSGQESKYAYYTTDAAAKGSSLSITSAYTYYKWNNRSGYFLDDAYLNGNHGLCLGDWDSNYSNAQHICLNRFCCGTPNGGMWFNESGVWKLEDNSTVDIGGDEYNAFGWAR
jgi:hypothetical protein